MVENTFIMILYNNKKNIYNKLVSQMSYMNNECKFLSSNTLIFMTDLIEMQKI